MLPKCPGKVTFFPRDSRKVEVPLPFEGEGRRGQPRPLLSLSKRRLPPLSPQSKRAGGNNILRSTNDRDPSFLFFSLILLKEKGREPYVPFLFSKDRLCGPFLSKSRKLPYFPRVSRGVWPISPKKGFPAMSSFPSRGGGRAKILTP